MSTAEHSPEQQPPYADMEAYVESMVDQFGYGSENHGSVPDAEADMAESVLDTLQPVGEPDEEGYYEKFVDPVSGKEVNGFTVNELRGMLDDRKERLEQEAAAQNQEREADVIALHRRNGDFRPESTGGHVNARRLRSALRSAELRDAERARKAAERAQTQESESGAESPTETEKAIAPTETETFKTKEDEQIERDDFARLYGAPSYEQLPKHFQRMYSEKEALREKVLSTHVSITPDMVPETKSDDAANEDVNTQEVQATKAGGSEADNNMTARLSETEYEDRLDRYRDKALETRRAAKEADNADVVTEAAKNPDSKGSPEEVAAAQEANMQTFVSTVDEGAPDYAPERGTNRLPKQPKAPKADRRIKGGTAEASADDSLELTEEEKSAPDIPGLTRHGSIIDARVQKQHEVSLLLQERLEAGNFTDEERKITPDPGMTLEATILARKLDEDYKELLALHERLDKIEAAGGLNATPGSAKVVEEFSTAYGIGNNTPEQITAFGTGAKPEADADDEDLDTEIVGLDELLDEYDSDESAPATLTDEELAEIEAMEKEFEAAYEARERERRLTIAPLSGPMPTMAYATPAVQPEAVDPTAEQSEPITNEQARRDPATVSLATESANAEQTEPIRPFSLTFTMPNLEDGSDKVTRVVTNPIKPGLQSKKVETTAETEVIEDEPKESAEELSRLARIKRIGSIGLIRVREAVLEKLSSYNEVGDRTGFDKRRVAAAAAGVIAAGAAVYLAQKGISGLGSIGREAANGVTPAPSGGANAAPGYNPYTGGSIGPMGGQETVDSVNPNVLVATPPAEVVTPTGGHQTNINSSSFWDQIQKEYHTNNQDTADVLRRSRELNLGIDLDHVKPNQSVIMADLTPPASNLPKPSTEQLNNFQTLSSGNGTNTASEAVLNALRDHGIQNLTPKQFNYAVEQALQYDAGIHRALGERVYDANHMPNGYHFYIPAFDDAMMRHIIDLEDAKSTVN